MDSAQLEQLKKSLKDVVVKTVNGKIDKIQIQLNAEAKKSKEHRDLMQPIYDVYATANNTGRFIIWLSKLFFGVGVIVGGILAIIKYLK